MSKKVGTCHLVGFAIPVDYRVKMKEGEKLVKYLDLAEELKKLWNVKVKVIPIVTGTLETIYKNLGKKLAESKIRRRSETIQFTILLKSTRILRTVLEI